jgi:hypothetical protein
MKQAKSSPPDPDLKPEYDFSRGVRGKYAARYAEGTNIVVLDPDVAAVFHDSRAVNDVLRGLLKVVHDANLAGVTSTPNAT